MRSGQTGGFHTLTLTCTPCWSDMYRGWEVSGLLSKQWPYEMHAARWGHGNRFVGHREADIRLVAWSLCKTGLMSLAGTMGGLKLTD